MAQLHDQSKARFQCALARQRLLVVQLFVADGYMRNAAIISVQLLVELVLVVFSIV